MDKLNELNAAIALLDSKLVSLLGNNALFVIVYHAKRYLEEQMADEMRTA